MHAVLVVGESGFFGSRIAASLNATPNVNVLLAGRGNLNSLARAPGVSVISGASTVPAVSSAVVDKFAPRFRRLDGIQIGISSGSRTPGLATVKGVFSYCGKPFNCWERGLVGNALRLAEHAAPSVSRARWDEMD